MSLSSILGVLRASNLTKMYSNAKALSKALRN